MNKGFTLIEVLVVVATMTILSSFMIIYTRGSENQIKILKDKAVLIGALARARSLALRTFTSSDIKVCGYGITVIDQNHFVSWQDVSPTLSCAEANRSYDGESENFETPTALSSGIIFSNQGDANFLKSMLFVPPNPDVVSSPVLSAGEQFKIVLGTLDGKSSAAMQITKSGQVQLGAGY